MALFPSPGGGCGRIRPKAISTIVFVGVSYGICDGKVMGESVTDWFHRDPGKLLKENKLDPPPRSSPPEPSVGLGPYAGRPVSGRWDMIRPGATAPWG